MSSVFAWIIATGVLSSWLALVTNSRWLRRLRAIGSIARPEMRVTSRTKKTRKPKPKAADRAAMRRTLLISPVMSRTVTSVVPEEADAEPSDDDTLAEVHL